MGNFVCPHCGMTNIDCGKEGYKTHRELELEQECESLKEEIGILQDNFETSSRDNHEIIEELEQEYEELELVNQHILDRFSESLMSRFSSMEEVLKKEDCYRKALDEIKEYTREQFCDNCEDIASTEYNCHCEYCEYQEYFDIIDKAKGE